MIDTDKYEGHDEEEWVITCDDGITWNIHTVSDKHLIECKLHNTVTNLVLMRDAPLLLAEVKRLQSIISVFGEYMMNDFMTDMSRSEAHAIWNELVRGDGI